jgi:hypothetical protein
VQRLNERNIKVSNRKVGIGMANTIKHNIPLFIMYILGSLIILFLGFLYLIAYILYCIFSTLWVMRFVCTHCPHYDKAKCPSGYARVSAKLFKKRSTRDFRKMFARNIGVVIPSWIIPVFVGIFLFIDNVSLVLLVLLILFVINGFVVLPLASRKYGCEKCELKDQCPWMGKFGK